MDCGKSPFGGNVEIDAAGNAKEGELANFRLHYFSLDNDDFSQDFDTRPEAIAFAAWLFLSGYYYGADGWRGESHPELYRQAGKLVEDLHAGRTFEWDRIASGGGYDAARIETV